MRRLFTAVFLIALVAALALSPLWAKTHSFKLLRGATVNGTQLAPGTYQLELKGEKEARIHRNGEVVVTAPVEVRPAKGKQSPGSVLQAADGSLLEVRLNKMVVVFAR